MPSLTSMSTPDAVLRRALEKEIQARDFYAGLAANCRVDFVRELLDRLQNEEIKHVRMIEAMLGRLDAGRNLVS